MLKSSAAIAFAWATGGVARQTPSSSTRSVKGPLVFLDYDQAELDAAYDQRVWAPPVERLRDCRRARIKAAWHAWAGPEFQRQSREFAYLSPRQTSWEQPLESRQLATRI